MEAKEINNSRGYKRPRAPKEKTHSFIHFMTKQAEARKISWEELSDRAGVNDKTLRRWRQGRTAPNLHDIERVLNILGFNIVPIRRWDV